MRRKYGFTGERYRELIQRIIQQNSINIANKLGRLGRDHYERAARKVSTQERRFVVPDVSEALPARGVFMRKAAVSGKRMIDTLRDRLTKNLRESMMQFTPKTGEATFITRRGVRAGRVNPKLVEEFERDMKSTFEGYTRTDPSYGVPANIHQIAVTELRSTADEVKASYMDEIARRNPDFAIRKRWVHNKRLSEQPRPHHMAIDGQTVKWDEHFVLGNGFRMRYPHEPGAPPEEVIGCNCDFDVLVQRLTD